MPIEFRQHITRVQLRAEPDTLFVFGDNLKRRGLGGQARQMRGEPNAVGLVTKRQPDMLKDSFFTDSDLYIIVDANVDAIPRLKRHLQSGGTVIWPKDGIGTGLAELASRAPKIALYYGRILDELTRIVAKAA